MKLIAWGSSKPTYRGPMHSTAELSREIGMSVQTLSNYLRADAAPKPVRKWSRNQSTNRGCNYYNRKEVLAFLKSIGVVK